MTKPKTLTIDVPKIAEKWQKLLIYLQNRVPDTFVLEFPDAGAAKKASACIYRVLSAGIPGCAMITAQRGCKVYVVKLHNAQTVIIREE